jgi:uncharacterized protein (DUF1501 family)
MDNPINSSRRSFLAALGASAASLPIITLPGFVQAAGSKPPSGNILVLVELSGGNDGLNTVVPVSDSAYRALRPSLGLSKRQTLTLDTDTGLHPSMRDMADLWDRGEMRIIEGVGYPNPNRSHFRSIEIWNAGFGAASNQTDGWISTAFANGNAPQADTAAGLVLGGDMGPLRGPGRFSSIRDEETFLETLDNLRDVQHLVRPTQKSPLEHVLATYDSAKITGDAISKRLLRNGSRGLDFPDTDLGRQLQTATRLLDAGVDVPVLKVVQDGYDTHEAQDDVHAFLLQELSEAVGAFSKAMKRIGLWDQVTVVTYSEFGRTARENGSAGTDHGTAAPVMVTGGAVKGGFDGQRVALDRLFEDDLVHTTDYRSVYAALLNDLWGISAKPFTLKGSAKLQIL